MRIALAVWRAKPEAYPTIDDWLFKDARPASLEEATRYAENLVGLEAFRAALKDKVITDRIQQGTEMFRVNLAETGKAEMPQLLLGQKIIVGGFKEVEQLHELLEAELRGTAPPTDTSS